MTKKLNRRDFIRISAAAGAATESALTNIADWTQRATCFVTHSNPWRMYPGLAHKLFCFQRPSPVCHARSRALTPRECRGSALGRARRTGVPLRACAGAYNGF